MEIYDCIVIGAGFSGVAAARELTRNGKKIKVLEARDRVGGRVYTQQYNDGFYLDLGGQWIGPTQTRMYELLEEYDLHYFPTYNQGINIIDINNKVKTYKGLIPKLDVISLVNLEFIIRKLDWMAKSIDIKKPYVHKKAKKYDSITLLEFLNRNSKTKKCKQVIQLAMETVFASNLSHVSLLHALFYIKSGTNLNTLFNIDDGAQMHRVKGGMQQVVEKMIEEFQGSLLLESPVTQIKKEGQILSVIGADFNMKTKKVIMAIPPFAMKNINMTDVCSQSKLDLMDNLVTGKVSKVFAIYDQPFWRDKSYSGQIISDSESSYLQSTFDASPDDGSRGILLGFSIGDRYDKFMEMEEGERKEWVQSQMRKYYGQDTPEMISYVDYSMEESEWSGGCYAAIYPKEQWTSHKGELMKPENNIHFAGTETSDVWMGYIEGAVRSGERAAREVNSEI